MSKKRHADGDYHEPPSKIQRSEERNGECSGEQNQENNRVYGFGRTPLEIKRYILSFLTSEADILSMHVESVESGEIYSL
jgi:hypothetical protein